ncbi:MAG TPA: L-fucose:H+ symporter permease [Pseudonocardia sp.]|jgi:FHS family L-fucose permease-like MFS transporter
MTQVQDVPEQPTASKRAPLVYPGLKVPFVLLTSCFAAWGIATAMTDPLVKVFSKIFSMNTLQSSLVQFAFYGAYFCLALPAAFINRRYSYKTGVLTGLAIFCVGAFLFYPAAKLEAYLPFLAALFILASGLSILETSANPFMISMGDERSATRRLNLAQAFNPVGTNIGILISTVFILTKLNPASEAERAAMPPGQLQAIQQAELGAVMAPYVIIALVLVALWIAFYLTKVPPAREHVEGDEAFLPTMRRLMRNPHYRFGVITQFFYVGAQTCTWTFTIQYIESSLDASAVTGGLFLQYSMIVFLISRFVFTYLMRFISPPRLLLAASVVAVLLNVVVILSPNIVGAWALVMVSFSMSLMFPTIYGVALHGLGADTKFGGAGLVMAILGGALLPLVQGAMMDALGAPASFTLMVLCFAVVTLYAWYEVRHGRIDTAGVPVTAGH